MKTILNCIILLSTFLFITACGDASGSTGGTPNPLMGPPSTPQPHQWFNNTNATPEVDWEGGISFSFVIGDVGAYVYIQVGTAPIDLVIYYMPTWKEFEDTLQNNGYNFEIPLTLGTQRTLTLNVTSGNACTISTIDASSASCQSYLTTGTYAAMIEPMLEAVQDALGKNFCVRADGTEQPCPGYSYNFRKGLGAWKINLDAVNFP